MNIIQALETRNGKNIRRRAWDLDDCITVGINRDGCEVLVWIDGKEFLTYTNDITADDWELVSVIQVTRAQANRAWDISQEYHRVDNAYHDFMIELGFDV